MAEGNALEHLRTTINARAIQDAQPQPRKLARKNNLDPAIPAITGNSIWQGFGDGPRTHPRPMLPTDFPDEPNSDTTLFYREYVPSTQRINFAPIVQRAESRARFHARLHFQEDSVEILRREWFCIAESNLVVMIDLSV